MEYDMRTNNSWDFEADTSKSQVNFKDMVYEMCLYMVYASCTLFTNLSFLIGHHTNYVSLYSYLMSY